MSLKLKSLFIFDSSEEEYHFLEIYRQLMTYQGGICSEGMAGPQYYRLNYKGL